jgi:hypothetical protein
MITQEKIDELTAAVMVAQQALDAAKAAFVTDLEKAGALTAIRAFASGLGSDIVVDFHAAVSKLESLL